jgi:hypothetical protein
MWIQFHEAAKIYARFCEARYGTVASRTVREKAQELKRKGDLDGYHVWNDVARQIEHPTVTPRSSDN